MRNALQSLYGASVVAVVIAACSNDPPAKTPDNSASTASSDTTITTPPGTAFDKDGAASTMTTTPTPSSEAASTDRMPTDSASASLSDEQILQITHVANQGEVDQGKLAVTKAKDARVKKLAAMMIKDHMAADAKGFALAKKDNIDMTPSTASANLENGAHDATQSLKDQKGADFDKAYVDTQIREHQDVLDSIDQKLAPNAKNADLKAYLTEVRSKVAVHLQHAKDLQTELEK